MTDRTKFTFTNLKNLSKKMDEPLTFKNIISAMKKTDEPIVFKNILNSTKSNRWKIIDWTLEDLAEKLGEMKLPFRVGKNTPTAEPQWESETPIEYKTMKEFLEETENPTDPSKWYYFDYKRVKDWFKDVPDFPQSFNWKDFEVDMDVADSVVWIGSEGAHTNCHQDTYGCNLIAQTHGRKLWLLVSPECNDLMEPTRIPYEESTIYSKHNFFNPSVKEVDTMKKISEHIKMVVLEPRDVLFVPHGWWHYVESLETSLSVNIWLPLANDCKARLNETIVNLVVSEIGVGLPKTPNQPETNLLECIEFIGASLEECHDFQMEPPEKRKKLNVYDGVLDRLKHKYPMYMRPLAKLAPEKINNLMKKNDLPSTTNGSEKKAKDEDDTVHIGLFETVVDAFCHPTIVSKISEMILEKVKKQSLSN